MGDSGLSRILAKIVLLRKCPRMGPGQAQKSMSRFGQGKSLCQVSVLLITWIILGKSLNLLFFICKMESITFVQSFSSGLKNQIE